MAVFWLFLLLLILFLVLLVFFRVKERRYLKKKLSETIDELFYQEMSGEEQEARRKQEKFSKALKKHQI